MIAGKGRLIFHV